MSWIRKRLVFWLSVYVVGLLIGLWIVGVSEVLNTYNWLLENQ